MWKRKVTTGERTLSPTYTLEKKKKKRKPTEKEALNADLCPVLEKSSLQPAGILTAAGSSEDMKTRSVSFKRRCKSN